jgi:hypothetical protein
MLESALEQLLLEFLDPYVDGIHRDKLRLGVFRGFLELKGLTVKPDALALLGFEGFRVRSGSIRVLKLTVPWTRIYTGKLRVDVDAVHLEVEQIGDVSMPDGSEAELVKEVREAKRKAIDLRATQLRDMLEHRMEQMIDAAAASQKRGYSMKLLRKILNNIHITLSDVRTSFINNNRGLACALEFPELRVLSTDQTFKERPDTEEVVVSGLSMYKLLKLRGLGIRMSSAGSSDLTGAEYVLTPISADLQLASVPSDQILRLRLDIATKEIAELTLKSSQVKHLLAVQAASFADAARLHALIVPPEEERSILLNVGASKAVYAELYERQLLFQWRLAGERDLPLNPDEVKRLQSLEDALSVRLLARQRLLVRSKVEALNEEVARRQREAEKVKTIEEQQNVGFMQRVFGLGGTDDVSATPEAPGSAGWLSVGEREQLMLDINDESKVEAVDLPQRLKFEFVLGKVSLDLIDDRWTDDVHRQLLSMALQDVHWDVDVDMVQHLGRDLAEWRIQCSLSTFRALHMAKNLCRLCPPELQTEFAGEAMSSEPSRERGFSWLEDGRSAVKLVLENKLQPAEDGTTNLLKLRFQFAPIEMHLFPGAFEQLIELFSEPTPDLVSNPATPVVGSLKKCQNATGGSLGADGISFEEVVDMSKDLFEVHGGAKEVAEKVYEQIPDRIHLDVRIASPIIHVPVAELGTATFSLGHLELVTPEPCAYDRINIAVNLTHTSLRAVSPRGEKFNMIEPVPVHFILEYSATDEVNTLNIQVVVQEVTLSLAPQALQILLAVPEAFASVLAPSDAVPTEAPAQASSTTAAQRASEFVREVLGDDAGAIEAAARRIVEQQEKQFKLSFRLQLDSLDVTLADAIVPVMRIHVEMLPPGLIIEKRSVPATFSLDVDTGAVEVEILNTRNGAWEPVVEQFHLGIKLVRTPESEEDFVTHVIVSGHQPLLLNVTPTAVQRICWVMPFFISAADNQSSGDNVARGEANAIKYRVVNICDHDIEIEFRCRHRDGIVMHIKPTGSLWEPLDDCVLPHFCTAVLARLPGGMSSEPLLLERAGAVMVPDSGVVAEMIAPSPSHRLLLLASPLRLRNETDLTLLVRFHDAVQREVLLVDVPDTTACDATVLGYDQIDGKVASHYTDSGHNHVPENNVLMLLPNVICAVPALALVRARGIVADNVHTWLSVKPAAFDADFCPALKAGAGTEPQTARCSGNGGIRDGLRDVNLILESHTYLAHPATPIALTTITLRPALTLLNALPIGNLTVGYTERAKDSAVMKDLLTTKWHETHVPRFCRFNVYDFPDMLKGVLIRARLEDDAPWSQPASFSAQDFEETESSKCLQLCQDKGAHAGILVEPLHRSELRFSCPCWLADRSGLTRPLALELRKDGRALPQADGITLLPADCFEESCDLVIHSACSVFAVQPIRMPPNWCALPWNTPCGSFVFCIQNDDVTSCDVLGAHCQVMTLRPRLILTNSSEYAIEMCFSRSRLLMLPAGESLEWHWQVQPGDEDLPSTGLLFRPQCDTPFAWSGAVVCSDTTAGSTPFLLVESTGEAPGERSGNIQVWSVDIAPVRGALAVTFRQGSDFVAVNRTTRTQMNIAIRPRGSDSDASPKMPLLPGNELPYGWTKPFHGNQVRSIDILIEGKAYRISDVRRTIRRVLPQLGLVVAITRSGTQTLLVVEDRVTLDLGGEALSPSSSQGTCLTRIEVKISSVGISLIEEVPQPRELMYCHFELVRLEWRQNDDDVEELALSISEMQMDCQLPGRIDARSADLRRKESLGLLQRERPAVVFANCANGDRAFLVLFLQRSATSSRDFVIPCAEITLDSLDLTIDEWWLDPLVNFLSQLSVSDTKGYGVPFDHIVQTAGRPIVDGYAVPPLPPVVQVDSLQLSEVNLTVWCALKLASARFLPSYVRTAIRVLSLSGCLTLDGAALSLQARTLPPHRGSLTDFAHGLADEYMLNLLRNTSAVLGKSSVLNLPRVPLRLGSTAVSYLSDTIGLAAGEAASLLSRLTFDEEYVMLQRQKDREKQIRGLGDGVLEASKSLAQGVEGLLDVVVKPVQGAQRNGLKGFLAGVGRGVAGTFVKPISKVGQAIADVGSGMAATVTTDSSSMKRRRARLRQRHPRLLFSEVGVVRPWSVLDAELTRQLGRPLTAGVECVLPLTQTGSQLPILMLFTRRLIVAEVWSPTNSGMVSATPARRSGTGASPSNGSKTPTPRRRDHLFDALDETGFKLFAQALKPINTLVYGVQDLNRSLSGKPAIAEVEAPANPVLSRRAREFLFCDLAAVHVAVDGGILQLEDTHGNIVDIPLFASPIDTGAREALAAGFRSVLDNAGGIADWANLNEALRKERRKSERERLYSSQSSTSGAAGTEHTPGSGGRSPGSTAGLRILEVFEVERWDMTMGEWKTPFLPIDRDLSWRWVDATGRKHPHLVQSLPRREIAAEAKPPCRPGALFHSTTDWTIDMQGADEDGWRYGLAWNASTWDDSAGLLDALRKRRWTRTYT